MPHATAANTTRATSRCSSSTRPWATPSAPPTPTPAWPTWPPRPTTPITRAPSCRLWDNIVNKKYYVTGGIGSGETSEGFGPNYSLRNNAYCESCSTCGLIFFQYKMNLAYHDAKYADLYEESLYNALLGSIDLEGKNFYYDNPLDSRGPRYAWHACPCCVGNIPRTLLMIPTWTYAKGTDGIYVNLFIGSTINVENVAGTDVQMVQETDYPWSGKVAITVNPEVAKSFSLLRPRAQPHDERVVHADAHRDARSCVSTSERLSITPNIEKGYAVITRNWKAGEVLREALASLAGRITVAFIYGSVARAEQRSSSDVDLMVVGDVSFGEVVSALETAQKTLGREINPTVYSAAEFRSKIKARHHFLTSVQNSEKVFVIGDEDEFDRLGLIRMARELIRMARRVVHNRGE